MPEQATIERAALAYVNFVRAGLAKPTVASLDEFRLEYRAGCIAHVTAVLSSLRPGDVLPGGMVVEQGWQPIETAPKDGTHILVCLEGPPFGPFWTFAQNPPTVAHWFGPPDSPGLRAGGWYLSVQQNDGGRVRPTHWMPLPAQPKEGE